jgi:hypothetical protein
MHDNIFPFFDYLEPIPKLSSCKQLYYLLTVQDPDSSHPSFHTL